MSYVHRHLPAEGCWTVGFYDGGGWEPVSDHDSELAAADEAARLNGCAPRNERTGKALSMALCGGQHALFALEALLAHPGDLPAYEREYLRGVAVRLRANLAEAERLEKL